MIEKYLVALVILSIFHRDPVDFGCAAYDQILRWRSRHELTEGQADQLYEVVGRYLWEQI